MEYFPESQTFSAEDADDTTSSSESSPDSDGYTFEGYTVEVNKKIELTPSAPPKTK